MSIKPHNFMTLIMQCNYYAIQTYRTSQQQKPLFSIKYIKRKLVTNRMRMLLGRLVVGLFLVPTFTYGSGEGNRHLLEEEVAAALKICTTTPGTSTQSVHSRQKREENVSKTNIDNYDNSAGSLDGYYEHVRRNMTTEKTLSMLNDTGTYDGVYGNDGSYGNNDTSIGNGSSYGVGGGGEDSRLVSTMPGPAARTRAKRLDPLRRNTEADECLSQCVFANLQVVDSRGIPREPELWSIVQSSVTSQQSRTALRDQLRACFQELESEAEDDGCSYSNKLERCLTLKLVDRQNTAAKSQ